MSMQPIELLWKLKQGDKVRLGKAMLAIKRVLDVKGKPDERMLDLGEGFFVLLTKKGYKIGRLAPRGLPVRVTKIPKTRK